MITLADVSINSFSDIILPHPIMFLFQSVMIPRTSPAGELFAVIGSHLIN
jgi:hypothetical protein